LRYDLSRLRAKGLVERIPHSHRYRLLDKGYSICVVFRKLFEKIYAPLAAALLSSFRGDCMMLEEKHCQLDRLYPRISDDLDANIVIRRSQGCGVTQQNENKILVFIVSFLLKQQPLTSSQGQELSQTAIPQPETAPEQGA
jgi:hypothetical protein